MYLLKKALNIVKNVLSWAIVLAAVLLIIATAISVATVDRNDRSVLGYRMYIVTTDSMSATDFAAGDLIFSKKVKPSTLQEGDIITFISQNTDSFGEILTHKIRRIAKTADGDPGFITYGTTTDTNDEAVVTYSYVLGKYTGKLAGWGRFFQFIKTPTGYFLCIFLPFMLIIAYEGTKIFVLLRRYRKEQLDEVQAERDRIAEERAANEKLLEELKQLKVQMEENKQMQNSECPTDTRRDTDADTK